MEKIKIIRKSDIIPAVCLVYAGYLAGAGLKPGGNLISWLDFETKLINGLPESFFQTGYWNRYTPWAVLACEMCYFLYVWIYRLERYGLMTGETFGTAAFISPQSVSEKIRDRGKDSRGKKRPGTDFYWVGPDGTYHEGRYSRLAVQLEKWWKGVRKRG